MFGKRKEDRPKRDHSGRNLAQYGLFDVTTQLSFDGDSAGMDQDDDDDLEAELLALTSDSNPQPKPQAKSKSVMPAGNLDVLVASSLRDIPSDEEISGDENDPELLNELSELTQDEAVKIEAPPVAKDQQETDITKLLDERLKMYISAEENAKKAGESSRARRFNRGIKSLKDLIRQARNGNVINEDDIPPEVSTGSNKKPDEPVVPVRTAPAIPKSVPLVSPAIELPEPEPEKSESKTVDGGLLQTLSSRRDEYKLAALQAKKRGDTVTAINFMKVSKQFDVVIKAVESGQPVDLSKMPGPPTEEPSAGPSRIEEQKKEETEIQQGGNDDEENVEEEEKLITASSIGEALEQRLMVYKKQEENAKAEGNAGKIRRMGRIVKQYEQAIKSYKLGKPIPIDELPVPPGYAPIVLNPDQSQTEPVKKPETPKQESTKQNTSEVPKEDTSAPVPPPRTNSSRKTGNQTATSFNDRQVALLLAKQREFMDAALTAKKKSEIAQAKEYLRTAKGFDRVIEAAKCGLPVDMDSLPIPPSARSQLEDSFDFVIADECKEDDTGTLDMLMRLDDQLTKQLKMCLTTRDHHKALGDVAGMNRFEHLALSVTKDLDIVRLAHRTNTEQVPKFHYENKSFSVVKCCTDLSDNDFELNIVRGINYNCTNPKEIDTYVKFEFPYPQEEPVRDRTITVKDTNNPEYNSSFILPIQRSARPCLRVFKRQAVKLEVYSRGGFFRGDTLLGTVNVKLQPLETQCELHDSYDLLDGRKKVGGKLELRMRVRHPLVARQVEQLNEKWLVIDH